MALAARDPQRLGAFDIDLLDVQIVRETDHPLAGHELQLSAHPAERDHELVFFTNPRARHIAFGVDTRDQLTSYYARARERGVTIPYAHDSGRAISFFIRDPEDNLVEIYWVTGQPRRENPPLSDTAASTNSSTPTTTASTARRPRGLSPEAHDRTAPRIWRGPRPGEDHDRDHITKLRQPARKP